MMIGVKLQGSDLPFFIAPFEKWTSFPPILIRLELINTSFARPDSPIFDSVKRLALGILHNIPIDSYIL